MSDIDFEKLSPQAVLLLEVGGRPNSVLVKRGRGDVCVLTHFSSRIILLYFTRQKHPETVPAAACVSVYLIILSLL